MTLPYSTDLIEMICGLMPHWQPGSVTIEAHLPGGYTHANYRVRYGHALFALRTPAGNPEARELALEADWLSSLQPGIGAQVVAFDPLNGALLSNWIDAPLLVHTPTTPTELVNYLVALHARLPAIQRHYGLSDRVDAWLAGLTVNRAVDQARARQARLPYPLQTTHNDLNPWNILCAADGWRTIDWEWVGRNDPLFDLVTLGLGLQLSDPALYDMAREYGDRVNIGIVELDGRLKHAICGFWLREYAWAEHALTSGNTRQEVVDQRDRALIMLKHL